MAVKVLHNQKALFFRSLFSFRRKKRKKIFDFCQAVDISVTDDNLPNVSELYTIFVYKILQQITDEECRKFLTRKKDSALTGFKSAAITEEVCSVLGLKSSTVVTLSSVMFEHYIDHGYGPGDYILLVKK